MANCALLRDVLLWCPSCPGLLLQSIPAVSRVTLHFCLGSFKGSDVSDHFPPGCKDKDAAVTASEGLLLCQDQLCCVVLCGAVMCSVVCCLIWLDGSVYSGSFKFISVPLEFIEMSFEPSGLAEFPFCVKGIHQSVF